MPSNPWVLGTLYLQPGGKGGFWTQPNGPNTLVIPQQQTSVAYFETTPFSELSGVFSCGCGHSCNYPEIYRDIDVNTGEVLAMVCCQLCSFLQYTVTYDLALSTVLSPQLPI